MSTNRKEAVAGCGKDFDGMQCGREAGHNGKHRGTGDFLGCTWTDAGAKRVLEERQEAAKPKEPKQEWSKGKSRESR
jgi:hypothetical protein